MQHTGITGENHKKLHVSLCFWGKNNEIQKGSMFDFLFYTIFQKSTVIHGIFLQIRIEHLKIIIQANFHEFWLTFTERDRKFAFSRSNTK
jgi:hypothetical protein